jgi:glycosyltransferase involved in cell wall biosynthesis
MKKDIGVYLAAEPSGGGAYQYNLSIIKALESIDPGKYNIIVFYFDISWNEIIPSNFLKVRVVKNFFGRVYSKLYRMLNNTPDGWRNAARFLQAVKAINASNCDLVIYPSQDPLAYQTDKRSVAAVHDLMHKYEPHFEEYQHGEYDRRELHCSAMCKYSSAILVDSEIGKKHVIESYSVDENKVFVLPFVPPFYLLNSQEVDVKSKYSLPERYIFYPAQFWEHKNHLNLFEALKILKEDGVDIDLVLVGSKKNNYEKSMGAIKRVGLCDRVHVLGYVPNDDIYSLYKNAVAMTFVSLAGPTNIPPMEALLTGCPLICSNAYAMQEQVGDAALLVEPKDPVDIAQKIKRIWQDENLRNELIKKGFQRTQKYGQKDFDLILGNLIDQVVQD